jgi:hypothetical protein
MVTEANGDMFSRKVGAAVVAERGGGAIHVFNSINHFFLIGRMIVPGSCCLNMASGMKEGVVQHDDGGMRTMSIPGENMAWLMNKIC